MAEPRKEMTFLDHLEELRWTLVRSAIGLSIAMIGVFLYVERIFRDFVMAPTRSDFVTYRVLCQLGDRLGMGDSFCVKDMRFELFSDKPQQEFMMAFSLAFTIGLVVASPFILWQLWRFAAPGLKEAERKAARGVIVFIILLFLLGAAFAYWVLVPMSMQFFSTYSLSEQIRKTYTVNSYVDIFNSFLLWTGLAFELPIVMVFLARIGLVGAPFLRKYRKHALVGILVVAAIITPPDVVSQVLVSLPLDPALRGQHPAGRPYPAAHGGHNRRGAGPLMPMMPPPHRAPVRHALLLLAVLADLLAQAQTTRITGKVTDAATGETLPFVSVSFVDSRISTNTDIDGNYSFDTYYATDSVRATSVGYKATTKAVRKDVAQVIDLELRPATAELVELVITPTENSAFSILRHVVANKPVNNREKLRAYQYEAYNKVEFDLNNITEDFTKKKLFKDFAFIFDYVDSSDAKPYLPIFMTETLSDVFYRQQPRTRREVIRGTKVSGVENESVSQFMGDMYQNVNIYDNFLVIFGKNFISPIADGGKGFYNYFLVDSNWVGHNWCYKLTFAPKRPQELAFTGEMWINDTSYAVRRVQATIAPGANLNFVQGFEVRQEYNEVAHEVWMLTKDELVVDLNVIRDTGEQNKHPVQGFYGRRTATYKDFIIDQPQADAFYAGADEVVMRIDPLSLGSDYWDQHRHVQLSEKEAAIYHMVDTMKTIPKFRTYVDVVSTVVTGYYTKGKVDLGPYFATYSFNPVEGNRFRIGARTSTNFNKRLEFEGHLAYGTKDGQFKMGLGGQGFVSKERREILGLWYKRDLEQLGQSTSAFRQDNILSSAFRRTPNTKLTLVEEYRASLEREWFTGFSNTVMVRYRNLFPRGSLAYERITGPELIPVNVNNIRTAELSLNTRFAYKEKYLSGDFRRVSLGTRYPAIELHAAFGIPRLLDSDYGYEKLVLHVYQRLQLGALGWTRLNVEGGRVWGRLPYPLLIIHSGNETFYLDDMAFNTMNFFEFISDRYVQAFVEHHFEGLFFNRIPLFRRLKWREVFVAKAVAGELARQEHEGEMKLLPGMYELDHGPFVEVSAGVENILKVLRVDGVWRLRYNGHPNTSPFALRLKLFVNF
ncbi:MAG: twin-arginine translocase subunit TatC [Flavobacteriales bacterium]